MILEAAFQFQVGTRCKESFRNISFSFSSCSESSTCAYSTASQHHPLSRCQFSYDQGLQEIFHLFDAELHSTSTLSHEHENEILPQPQFHPEDSRSHGHGRHNPPQCIRCSGRRCFIRIDSSLCHRRQLVCISLITATSYGTYPAMRPS